MKSSLCLVLNTRFLLGFIFLARFPKSYGLNVQRGFAPAGRAHDVGWDVANGLQTLFQEVVLHPQDLLNHPFRLTTVHSSKKNVVVHDVILEQNNL